VQVHSVRQRTYDIRARRIKSCKPCVLNNTAAIHPQISICRHGIVTGSDPALSKRASTSDAGAHEAMAWLMDEIPAVQVHHGQRMYATVQCAAGRLSSMEIIHARFQIIRHSTCPRCAW
jgi:hypothetical protein